MATEGGGVYFPVDAGFCDTTVARQVTRRLGHEGFHAYVRLLCCLLNEPGGRLPLQLAEEWEDLSDRLGLDLEKAKELVAVMEHYGALEREEGYVFSPLVSSSILARNQVKEQKSRAGKASAEARKRKKQEQQANGAGNGVPNGAGNSV